MLNTVDFYYFSPTGGTKKCGDAFCGAVAKNTNPINLGSQDWKEGAAELAVVAMPVFAGRIPSAMPERIAKLNGKGKKAVTLAVYGVRAYDDALLEMNDLLRECGFEVVASAALVAEHSIAREVGRGRPDAKDVAEIQAFAATVCDAIACGAKDTEVPGNRPYRDGMTSVPATPVSLEACNRCGACAAVCPTNAICVGENVTTDKEKCMMCMACVAACPQSARILPPPLQEGMNQKLGALKDVQRENEFYIGK